MLKKKEKKTGYYLGKNYLGIKVLGTKKQDGDLGTDEAGVTTSRATSGDGKNDPNTSGQR